MTELFTRLTHNTEHWEIPSGHAWKKEKQGSKEVPFENQYGFGHEEWLFNPRYNVKGWQYGYIRGMSKKPKDQSFDKVHLYSVEKHSKGNLVYYLGYLRNVYTLPENWFTNFFKVEKVFEKYTSEVISELKFVKADETITYREPFRPVVRFRIDEANLLDEPQPIDDFPLSQYKRFQPYAITDIVLNSFKASLPIEVSKPFIFSAGKASQSQRFTRYMEASEKSVVKTHSKIIDELERFLSPKYALSKKNISIEKTRFSKNIADLVVQEDIGTISIYEIKTSNNIRRNIREAVGQLLDYSSFTDSVKVEKIVVVSPCKLIKEGAILLNSIKKLLKISLIYMQYDETLPSKFLVNY